jgi:hypothetical protein
MDAPEPSAVSQTRGNRRQIALSRSRRTIKPYEYRSALMVVISRRDYRAPDKCRYTVFMAPADCTRSLNLQSARQSERTARHRTRGDLPRLAVRRQAARRLPDYAMRDYIDSLAAGPEALHASFAMYRALDTTIAPYQGRKNQRLAVPTLAIGGEHWANSSEQR